MKVLRPRLHQGWIPRSITIACFTTLLSALMLRAEVVQQAPLEGSSTGLAYDVAAIHLSRGMDHNSSINENGDALSVHNASLREMIAEAYSIREDLILGLPSWAVSEHYDIQGKITDADAETLKKLTDAQHRVMLQALLAARFQLKVHKRFTVQPVYDLTVGSKGSKLRPVATSKPATAAGSDTFHGLAPGSLTIHSSGAEAELIGHAVTVEQLAFVLSYQVERSVIDKTRLPGAFNVDLTWKTSDDKAGFPAEPIPHLITAIQEQLGLKLVSAKGPVQEIVVDTVHAPTKN